MLEKSFSQIFDLKLFEQNTMLIDERGCLNCDFLIIELAKHHKLSIYQFNDCGDNLKAACSKYNFACTVNSIYTSKYASEEIIDDAYTLNRLTGELNRKIKKSSCGVQEQDQKLALHDNFDKNVVRNSTCAKITVFRSGTANKADYYCHDIVIIVDRLRSGCSSEIDGSIRIIRRDEVISDIKYKIYADRIAYFD